MSKKNKITPVVETIAADLLTPLAVFLKLSEAGSNAFLLESVEGGRTLARYSFIGARPDSVISKSDASIVDDLRQHFGEYLSVKAVDLPPFIGGAIGYFDFGCTAWFEPALSGKLKSEGTAEFMFFRTIVAFDHVRQQIKIISLAFSDDEMESAKRHIAEIRGVLEDGRLPFSAKTASNGSDLRSNWKREDFEASVISIKEMISAGECYQVVLSQCFTRPTKATDVAIYRALRSINPSPYMFLLRFDGKSVVGASPELLVKAEGEKLQYRPIAGTRKRGETDIDDAELAADMLRDPKEISEHMMLVDLGRNDLGRVSQYGSVKVDQLMQVEKYSHVQHLVSSLSSTIDDGKDRFDALASCFPAGTVSGAPKVRAVEIISDLEPTSRGIYAGAVGYFDYSGNMDMCIAIRTLVLENGVAKVQAGAGIVADSDPASEFQETVNKAAGLLHAIDIAERGDL